MQPRVPVPKLFRRGDRWYVRVQVPKRMQDVFGKREYWLSLKTDDRQRAMHVAPDVVRRKRGEMLLRFNQITEQWKSKRTFSEDEYLALLREAYSMQTSPKLDLVLIFEYSGLTRFEDFLHYHEKRLRTELLELTENRGHVERIDNMMQAISKKNGIQIVPNSQADTDLRKLCIESYIEARKHEIALARSQSVHSDPNPNIIDRETGLAKGFTPLSEILARPIVEPNSLKRLVEQFINDPNKLRAAKTVSTMRGYLDAVIEILGDGTPPDRITEEDCIRVRDVLIQLPPNFKKLPQLRNRPIEEMVRLARQNDMNRLSPTGVNNYLKYLMAFLTWCYKRGKIDRIPTAMSEIQVADPIRKEDKRLPFSNTQLSTIFHSEVYAEDRRRDCMFWVPLIALWNGMRSNEICQLDTADIKVVEGIWGFDITDISANGGDDKRIKTDSSIRLLPIHPELIEFGLLDFHMSRPAGSKLFSDITLGQDGYYSSTFSKRSNRYLERVGVHGPKHVFHSLRHNFKDAMQKSRVIRDIAKALGGWTRGKTDAFDIYGSGYPLDELYSELSRVDYPDVDWSHLKV